MEPRLLDSPGQQESTAEIPEEARKSPFFASSLPVFCLVLCALALRVWGIDWSLPNKQHAFTYHPDEGVNLVQGVLDKGNVHPHLDLQFYNYGGLYFYLWQGAAAINQSYGLVHDPSATRSDRASTTTFAAMLKVGRLLTALLGALTVWAIAVLGTVLFGRAAGWIAGAAYAIMPAAVVHGHYATVDVPATFFVTLALLFSARLLKAEEGVSSFTTSPLSGPATLGPRFACPFTPSVLLAGLFCGLAAATKYNCGLVLFAPLAAVFLQWPDLAVAQTSKHLSGGRVKAALVLLGAAAAGFLIGCPGILVDQQRFWQDFTFELAKSRQGMGLLFVHTGNGWLYHLTSSLRFGLGVPLLLFTLAALTFALVRRTREDAFLLAFLVPYYLVIGYAQVRYLRYVIPLFPVFAVLVGRLIADPPARQPGIRRVIVVTGALAGVVTLLITLSLDRLMTLVPAQDQAYAYIQQHVPHGKSIGFATTPWYYTPPLSPLFTAPAGAPAHSRVALEVTEYLLRVPDPTKEWDAAVLAPPPDYFVLSDVESEDAKRLNLPYARSFFDTLKSQYTPTVFENTPSIFGLDFGKPAYVPNDWLYIYPGVTLYTRR